MPLPDALRPLRAEAFSFLMIMEEKEPEVWKNIEGFEGFYQVSNRGNVRSVDRTFTFASKGNIIQRSYKSQTKKGRLRKDGYVSVNLRMIGTVTHISVHRLVASAFIENPDNKPYVNHKNGNKQNNNDWNLEWCTAQENTAHAINLFNIKGPSRKFDRNQIFYILSLISRKDIREFWKINSVGESTVGRIRKGEVYKEWYSEYIDIHGLPKLI